MGILSSMKDMLLNFIQGIRFELDVDRLVEQFAIDTLIVGDPNGIERREQVDCDLLYARSVIVTDGHQENTYTPNLRKEELNGKGYGVKEYTISGATWAFIECWDNQHCEDGETCLSRVLRIDERANPSGIASALQLAGIRTARELRGA